MNEGRRRFMLASALAPLMLAAPRFLPQST